MYVLKYGIYNTHTYNSMHLYFILFGKTLSSHFFFFLEPTLYKIITIYSSGTQFHSLAGQIRTFPNLGGPQGAQDVRSGGGLFKWS